MNKTNMQKMMSTVSKKLGISNEELQTMLKDKDINGIMAKMNPKEADKLKEAMNNPEVMKMANTPEMKKYMES